MTAVGGDDIGVEIADHAPAAELAGEPVAEAAEDRPVLPARARRRRPGGDPLGLREQVAHQLAGDELELLAGLHGGERELPTAHRERLFRQPLISGHVKPRLRGLGAPKGTEWGGLLGFVIRSFRTRAKGAGYDWSGRLEGDMSPGDERIREQLARWRDDLLDMTGRNPLLRFRHARVTSFEITSPDAQTIVDRLLSARSREWLVHVPDDGTADYSSIYGNDDEGPVVPRLEPTPRAARDGVLYTTKRTAKDVIAACAGLSRKASQEWMDRGVWILYLGIGMLSWVDPDRPDAETQESPLLLFPVNLEASGTRDWKLLPTDEEAAVNPALWLRLEGELQLTMPEFDPEEPINVQTVLNGVRTAIADQPGWEVAPRVVLRTFSFAKLAMYKDLRDNFEKIVEHPIVASLAADPDADAGAATSFDFDPIPEEKLDELAPLEQAMSVLDADASQRQCVAAARQGHSFVMDGPPGTGKSQTITNMIAELIARGRTVLFVSEKAAALDVVRDRLISVGLEDYLLELHSHKTTRAAVASALGASLTRRPKPNPILGAHELIEAQRRREELNRYADTVNAPIERLDGRTLHHVLGWIAELQHLPQAPVAERPPETMDELSEVWEMGQRLHAAWAVVERGEDFLWRGATAESWGASVEQRITMKLHDLRQAAQALQATADGMAEDLLLDPPAGPRNVPALASLVEKLTERPAGVQAGWLSLGEPERLDALARRAAERAQHFQALAEIGRAAAGEAWEVLADPRAASIAATLQSPGGIPAGAGAADGDRLANQVVSQAEFAEALHAAVVDLASIRGLRTSELSMSAAAATIELANLSHAEGERPPAAWLAGEQALEEAQAIVKRMIELLGAEAAARSAAADFEPAVLELDLESLQKRFAEDYPGLKKLSGAYRADRATLAATAPRLKPKAAIAAIDAALAWQRAHRELLTVASENERILSTGWKGSGTNAEVLARQSELAESIMVLARGTIADQQRFAQVMSGQRSLPDDEQLIETADRNLSRLRAETTDQVQSLADQPLMTVASALRQRAPVIREATTITAQVDRVRGRAGSIATALQVAASAEQARELRGELREDLEAQNLLGQWAEVDQDHEKLLEAVAWATDAVATLPRAPSHSGAERLCVATPDAQHLIDAFRRWRDSLHPFLAELEISRRNSIAENLETDFADTFSLIDDLTDTRGDIQDWIAFRAAAETLSSLGLGKAVQFAKDRHIPSGEIAGVLRRSALEALADQLLAERGEQLGPLRSIDRDRLVREFADLDERTVKNACHRVIEAANARRPTAILGLAATIASEAEKKRKHMPVARLLAKTAEVAQAIKPVFAMSPLTVSQFLSPDMHFDVVIFDEASQVRPCDAINCLYRADAMIIAGDQKQLPPTNFFTTSTDSGDEYDEEELREYDSVLDLAKSAGRFRSLSLRWHYRSRHEDLIAFSNHQFYEGELVTFPGPDQHSDDLGVELYRVDGTYRPRTSKDNPVEARKVVDRVFAHAERGHRSIGVVAFSEAQASFIDEALRQDPRHRDPRFESLFSTDRLGALFVKNLENVQGDERDVIIFSVGYGPDENGNFSMKIGPITNEGGWRRLNVAITRARKRVEVINSFAPERITATKHRGPQDLRRYLEYAERGPSVLAVDRVSIGGEPESPFEEAVMRTLRAWGHDVVAQVGTAGYRIDLAIRHPEDPGRYLLGIECDGAMYHSSRAARDRDRLREAILRNLRWQLHRIWGPSWYRDRPGEERRLREAIDRALRAPHTPEDTPETSPAPVDLTYEDLVLGETPIWVEPYRAATLPPARTLDPCDWGAGAELRSYVQQAVAEEGPIVEDFLIRRVIEPWSVHVTERRRNAVRSILHTLLSTGTLIQRGNAICFPQQRHDILRAPVDDDPRTTRDVKAVPDIELAQTIERLVTEARSASSAELQQRTARIFGWRRNGPWIQAALTRTIDELVATGRIRRVGDHLEACDHLPLR